MAEVTTYSEADLTDREIEAIVTLTNSVWPKDRLTLKNRIQQAVSLVRSPDRAKVNPVRFVVWDNEQVIAHAAIFDRLVHVLDVNDQSTRSVRVLALAGVCSDPSRRGQGLGLAVVNAAFEKLSRDRPVSLFQTGVPQFYEKLGGRIVDNRFVNLLDTTEPQANPWWDEHVMIVPGNQAWPTGKIDLNGAGY